MLTLAPETDAAAQLQTSPVQGVAGGSPYVHTALPGSLQNLPSVLLFLHVQVIYTSFFLK